jgi:hypothetical protein
MKDYEQITLLMHSILNGKIYRDVHEITPAIGAQIVVRLARSDLSKSAGVLVVHRAFAK